MRIEEIDKNFKLGTVGETDVEWLSASDVRFALYGVYYDENEQRYRRMPQAESRKVSHEVDFLAINTTGGRLRFITDSPYVAIKAVEPNCGIAPQMTIYNQCGFALYKNGRFMECFSPTLTETLVNCKTQLVPGWDEDFNRSTEFSFSGISYLDNDGKACNVSLFFPLYGGVSSLFIGLKKGCTIKHPKPYTYTKPVVFYGSSITQGGCASIPGNDYVNRISRILDCDVKNLGFSGNGKGEQSMAQYIAGLSMSAFVLDYDHNARTVEHLRNTHYAFYETVRMAQKNIPIIMITRPTSVKTKKDVQEMEERKKVIHDSYLRAKNKGDTNVYFLDGRALIKAGKDWSNTVDGGHPNDIGFLNMAKGIAKVLKESLSKN